jgi:transposase
MEDVLDLYHQPYDPKHPQVCMDETSKQLVSEVIQPIPASPRQVERYDYEYERQGVANLFILFEPLAGWRHLKVTERRTKQDWALLMKELVDVHYPEAETIRLVLDNLNTHVSSSLYETFQPVEAKRILDKLELHYTPKHGSWLNMAEIEFSVLSRQCLDRRIGNQQTLIREVTAWQNNRNDKAAKMDWRFTTADARIKLKKLYPSIPE